MNLSNFVVVLSLAIICHYCEGQIVRKIITNDKAPLPLSWYSQAVQIDNTLYISGNLGMDIDGNLVDGIAGQTQLAFENIRFVLEAAGTTFDNVIQVTVMLADIEDYAEMNEIYGKYFTSKYPARSAFQVGKLPKNALVEIEAVAVVGDIVDVNQN